MSIARTDKQNVAAGQSELGHLPDFGTDSHSLQSETNLHLTTAEQQYAQTLANPEIDPASAYRWHAQTAGIYAIGTAPPPLSLPPGLVLVPTVDTMIGYAKLKHAPNSKGQGVPAAGFVADGYRFHLGLPSDPKACFLDVKTDSGWVRYPGRVLAIRPDIICEFGMVKLQSVIHPSGAKFVVTRTESGDLPNIDSQEVRQRVNSMINLHGFNGTGVPVRLLSDPGRVAAGSTFYQGFNYGDIQIAFEIEKTAQGRYSFNNKNNFPFQVMRYGQVYTLSWPSRVINSGRYQVIKANNKDSLDIVLDTQTGLIVVLPSDFSGGYGNLFNRRFQKPEGVWNANIAAQEWQTANPIQMASGKPSDLEAERPALVVNQGGAVAAPIATPVAGPSIAVSTSPSSPGEMRLTASAVLPANTAFVADESAFLRAHFLAGFASQVGRRILVPFRAQGFSVDVPFVVDPIAGLSVVAETVTYSDLNGGIGQLRIIPGTQTDQFVIQEDSLSLSGQARSYQGSVKFGYFKTEDPLSSAQSPPSIDFEAFAMAGLLQGIQHYWYGNNDETFIATRDGDWSGFINSKDGSRVEFRLQRAALQSGFELEKTTTPVMGSRRSGEIPQTLLSCRFSEPDSTNSVVGFRRFEKNRDVDTPEFRSKRFELFYLNVAGSRTIQIAFDRTDGTCWPSQVSLNSVTSSLGMRARKAKDIEADLIQEKKKRLQVPEDLRADQDLVLQRQDITWAQVIDEPLPEADRRAVQHSSVAQPYVGTPMPLPVQPIPTGLDRSVARDKEKLKGDLNLPEVGLNFAPDPTFWDQWVAAHFAAPTLTQLNYKPVMMRLYAVDPRRKDGARYSVDVPVVQFGGKLMPYLESDGATVVVTGPDGKIFHRPIYMFLNDSSEPVAGVALTSKPDLLILNFEKGRVDTRLIQGALLSQPDGIEFRTYFPHDFDPQITSDPPLSYYLTRNLFPPSNGNEIVGESYWSGIRLRTGREVAISWTQTTDGPKLRTAPRPGETLVFVRYRASRDEDWQQGWLQANVHEDGEYVFVESLGGLLNLAFNQSSTSIHHLPEPMPSQPWTEEALQSQIWAGAFSLVFPGQSPVQSGEASTLPKDEPEAAVEPPQLPGEEVAQISVEAATTTTEEAESLGGVPAPSNLGEQAAAATEEAAASVSALPALTWPATTLADLPSGLNLGPGVQMPEPVQIEGASGEPGPPSALPPGLLLNRLYWTDPLDTEEALVAAALTGNDSDIQFSGTLPPWQLHASFGWNSRTGSYYTPAFLQLRSSDQSEDFATVPILSGSEYGEHVYLVRDPATGADLPMFAMMPMGLAIFTQPVGAENEDFFDALFAAWSNYTADYYATRTQLFQDATVAGGQYQLGTVLSDAANLKEELDQLVLAYPGGARIGLWVTRVEDDETEVNWRLGLAGESWGQSGGLRIEGDFRSGSDGRTIDGEWPFETIPTDSDRWQLVRWPLYNVMIALHTVDGRLMALPPTPYPDGGGSWTRLGLLDAEYARRQRALIQQVANDEVESPPPTLPAVGSNAPVIATAQNVPSQDGGLAPQLQNEPLTGSLLSRVNDAAAQGALELVYLGQDARGRYVYGAGHADQNGRGRQIQIHIDPFTDSPPSVVNVYINGKHYSLNFDFFVNEDGRALRANSGRFATDGLVLYFDPASNSFVNVAPIDVFSNWMVAQHRLPIVTETRAQRGALAPGAFRENLDRAGVSLDVYYSRLVELRAQGYRFVSVDSFDRFEPRDHTIFEGQPADRAALTSTLIPLDFTLPDAALVPGLALEPVASQTPSWPIAPLRPEAPVNLLWARTENTNQDRFATQADTTHRVLQFELGHRLSDGTAALQIFVGEALRTQANGRLAVEYQAQIQICGQTYAMQIRVSEQPGAVVVFSYAGQMFEYSPALSRLTQLNPSLRLRETFYRDFALSTYQVRADEQQATQIYQLGLWLIERGVLPSFWGETQIRMYGQTLFGSTYGTREFDYISEYREGRAGGLDVRYTQPRPTRTGTEAQALAVLKGNLIEQAQAAVAQGHRVLDFPVLEAGQIHMRPLRVGADTQEGVTNASLTQDPSVIIPPASSPPRPLGNYRLARLAPALHSPLRAGLDEISEARQSGALELTYLGQDQDGDDVYGTGAPILGGRQMQIHLAATPEGGLCALLCLNGRSYSVNVEARPVQDTNYGTMFTLRFRTGFPTSHLVFDFRYDASTNSFVNIGSMQTFEAWMLNHGLAPITTPIRQTAGRPRAPSYLPDFGTTQMDRLQLLASQGYRYAIRDTIDPSRYRATGEPTQSVTTNLPLVALQQNDTLPQNFRVAGLSGPEVQTPTAPAWPIAPFHPGTPQGAPLFWQPVSNPRQDYFKSPVTKQHRVLAFSLGSLQWDGTPAVQILVGETISETTPSGITGARQGITYRASLVAYGKTYELNTALRVVRGDFGDRLEVVFSLPGNPSVQFAYSPEYSTFTARQGSPASNAGRSRGQPSSHSLDELAKASDSSIYHFGLWLIGQRIFPAFWTPAEISAYRRDHLLSVFVDGSVTQRIEDFFAQNFADLASGRLREGVFFPVVNSNGLQWVLLQVDPRSLQTQSQQNVILPPAPDQGLVDLGYTLPQSQLQAANEYRSQQQQPELDYLGHDAQGRYVYGGGAWIEGGREYQLNVAHNDDGTLTAVLYWHGQAYSVSTRTVQQVSGILLFAPDFGQDRWNADGMGAFGRNWGLAFDHRSNSFLFTSQKGILSDGGYKKSLNWESRSGYFNRQNLPPGADQERMQTLQSQGYLYASTDNFSHRRIPSAVPSRQTTLESYATTALPLIQIGNTPLPNEARVVGLEQNAAVYRRTQDWPIAPLRVAPANPDELAWRSVEQTRQNVFSAQNNVPHRVMRFTIGHVQGNQTPAVQIIIGEALRENSNAVTNGIRHAVEYRAQLVAYGQTYVLNAQVRPIIRDAVVERVEIVFSLPDRPDIQFTYSPEFSTLTPRTTNQVLPQNNLPADQNYPQVYNLGLWLIEQGYFPSVWGSREREAYLGELLREQREQSPNLKPEERTRLDEFFARDFVRLCQDAVTAGAPSLPFPTRNSQNNTIQWGDLRVGVPADLPPPSPPTPPPPPPTPTPQRAPEPAIPETFSNRLDDNRVRVASDLSEYEFSISANGDRPALTFDLGFEIKGTTVTLTVNDVSLADSNSKAKITYTLRQNGIISVLCGQRRFEFQFNFARDTRRIAEVWVSATSNSKSLRVEGESVVLSTALASAPPQSTPGGGDGWEDYEPLTLDDDANPIPELGDVTWSGIVALTLFDDAVGYEVDLSAVPAIVPQQPVMVVVRSSDANAEDQESLARAQGFAILRLQIDQDSGLDSERLSEFMNRERAHVARALGTEPASVALVSGNQLLQRAQAAAERSWSVQSNQPLRQLYLSVQGVQLDATVVRDVLSQEDPQLYAWVTRFQPQIPKDLGEWLLQLAREKPDAMARIARDLATSHTDIVAQPEALVYHLLALEVSQRAQSEFVVRDLAPERFGQALQEAELRAAAVKVDPSLQAREIERLRQERERAETQRREMLRRDMMRR